MRGLLALLILLGGLVLATACTASSEAGIPAADGSASAQSRAGRDR